MRIGPEPAMTRPRPLFLLLFLSALFACQAEAPAGDVIATTPQKAWRLVGSEGAAAATTVDETGALNATAEPSDAPAPLATITLRPGAAAILYNTPRASSGAGEGADEKKNTTENTPEEGTPKIEDGGATPAPAGTPTETLTPGPPTRTPTPTLTPTATPIPSAADAPLFPETPVRPFDPADFRETLRLLDDSMRSFEQNWLLILRDERERNRGDCGSFLGWFTLWVTQAPFYTDVPPQWNDLVYSYRTFLADAVYFSSPIQRQCPGMSSDIRINRDLTINFFTTAHARSTEMLQRAWALGD